MPKLKPIGPARSPDGAEVYEVVGVRPTGTRDLSIALAIVRPGEATRRHVHDFTEAYIFIDGEGLMRLGEEEFEVKPGDCVLIPRGAPHSVEARGDRPLRFYCICAPAFTEEGTRLVS